MPKYLKKYLLLNLLFIFSLSSLSAQNADINLLNDINPDNPSSGYWQKTSQSIYPLTVGLPIGMIAGGYFTHNKQLMHSGVKVVEAVAVNTVIAVGMKYIINRDRPYEKYPLIVHPYDTNETTKSFPSGHTSTAFALATSLSIEYPKWYIITPAFLYAANVGYSRLYLGVHYPSDVLAGAVVGAGSAYLSHWLNKKLIRKK